MSVRFRGRCSSSEGRLKMKTLVDPSPSHERRPWYLRHRAEVVLAALVASSITYVACGSGDSSTADPGTGGSSGNVTPGVGGGGGGDSPRSNSGDSPRSNSGP